MAKFMDLVRSQMRTDGYSDNTIKTYSRWIVRYIVFHQMTHPEKMGIVQVNQFLEHLAVAGNSAASTNNQALDALAWMYRAVIKQPIDRDIRYQRAKTGRRLPETASNTEIVAVINELPDKYRLMARLVYGAGLSLNEVSTLRMQSVNFERGAITVSGRETVMPQLVYGDLRRQVEIASTWPGNVDGYVFPSSRLVGGRCYHVSPSSLQKAMKQAARRVGVDRRITPRVLRHSFALHLIDAGYNVRTVQELMGHRSVRQTLVYKRMADKKHVRSPLD